MTRATRAGVAYERGVHALNLGTIIRMVKNWKCRNHREACAETKALPYTGRVVSRLKKSCAKREVRCLSLAVALFCKCTPDLSGVLWYQKPLTG